MPKIHACEKLSNYTKKLASSENCKLVNCKLVRSNRIIVQLKKEHDVWQWLSR